MVQGEEAVMKRLLSEGVPLAEVARRLGRARQTVYNWINRGPAAKHRRPSKLDRFRTYIDSRLERFDLPATALLRELRRMGYDGGITILREVVASIKQRHVQRLVDRFETEPGRQAQVDWASCGTIVHRGRRRRLSLLVVVLGHSRMIWARFVVTEHRGVLMELLERAFHALGGVPRELLFDNLKQVVAQPRTKDAPAMIQRELSAFADHWGFDVLACPPYWPRAKGKVERAIGYIKRSFLEGRSFTDLETLNAQLDSWLAEVANVRVHATTKARPCDRWAADREAMRPLSATAYPTTEVHHRLADHDAFISFRSVRYSVDPSILTGRRGEPVEVHVSTDERLTLHHQGRLVGNHAIAPPGSPAQDDVEHARLRRTLRQKPSWTPAKSRRPRFDQHLEVCDMPWLADAPQVAARPLAVYEATS
jgi:transposase